MRLVSYKVFFGFFLVFSTTVFLIIVFMDRSIQKLVKEKQFLIPTLYYGSPKKFYKGQIYGFSRFKTYFERQNYRRRDFGSSVQEGDFSLGQKEDCYQITGVREDIFSCLLFRNRDSRIYFIELDEQDRILNVFAEFPANEKSRKFFSVDTFSSKKELLKKFGFKPVSFAKGEPESFAQFLGNKPIQQKKVLLDDIPRYCLDAVIAIEDSHFLKHQGVSLRAVFRAFLANLREGSWSQGGSTITQQLVKNYFLTNEKTLIRKFKELIISLILEFRISKDDILEIYLNIIYLGQSGIFEIRGYGSAADFYFQNSIDQLNLHQCALMAAIVNSPGVFNPVKYPERAKERRDRVLARMLKQNLISQEEFQEAVVSPLPERVKSDLAVSAPYYVSAVNRKLKELGIRDHSGLKVYTAMDFLSQKLAEKAVIQGLEYFEKNHPVIKKLKEKKSLFLQSVLLAGNPETGEVTAIVGGRSFLSSPFNRATESRRQVGSVFKPIVYLTSIMSVDKNGQNYSPKSILDNAPFRYEYEGQVWEPRNYNNHFSAPVPLFYAFKESMNIPTARLAMGVGLKSIIDVARSLGVESELKEFPSLSLGAFELLPIEVLKVYNTLSQMGLKRKLQIVKSVVNHDGEVLYSHQDSSVGNQLEKDKPLHAFSSKKDLSVKNQVQKNPFLKNRTEKSFSKKVEGTKEDFAVLIGMMKETFKSGTARGARKMGFHRIAAGKTGTTSETKDAWFAGFTPFHTAVVWVGYDNGTPHTLTGASGALPIWSQYMGEITKFHVNQDFYFPDTVEKRRFSTKELIQWGVPTEKAVDTELIFKINE